MTRIIVKFKDNTETQIDEEYAWSSDITNELNDTRYNFINIGDHIFAKDTIASVVLEKIKESKNESNS